jgi:hypothetical protein
MEYIKLEQFKSLEENIQKVFLDWWKPKRYDLYIDSNDLSQVECLDFVHENEEGILYFSMRDNISELEDMVPLLNECQLRKFIKDKTGYQVALIELDYDHYNIVLRSNNKAYITEEHDLLQAYWKVALEIAKEA